MGLINYDFRRKLTSSQKGNIKKLYNKWYSIVKHPELFHAANVNKADAQVFSKSKYKVTPRNRVFIPLHDFDTAKIDHGKIILKKNGKKETIYPVGHKDFHAQLKKFAARPLKNNQMLTVKIGTSQAFSQRFNSYESLYKYIAEEFEPKDPGESKENLMALMSIVEINKRVDPNDVDEDYHLFKSYMRGFTNVKKTKKKISRH